MSDRNKNGIGISRSGYVYGTAAEKISRDNVRNGVRVNRQYNYDVYEENTVLREIKDLKALARSRLRLVAGLLAVFAAFCFLMYRYALITELNYSLNKASQNYSEILDANTRLRVDIEKQTDLLKIREIAETEYGMHKPDVYQTFYVKIDKNDRVLVSDAYVDKMQDGSGFVVFRGILNKLAGLIH